MPCLPPPACHDLRCGALTNDFITGTASELRCSARKDMAKKRRRRNAKRAKKATRPRDAPRESKNYAFTQTWAWGRAVTHIQTCLQSGIINYSQCESKPVCSCCVDQRCKTATAEKLKKKKKKETKRKSNKKGATTMSWPEPEQRSRA